MGIFNSIFGNAKIGIQLSNQLIKVLFKDKGLFVYPIVMAILSFLILVGIFVPLIFFTGGAFLSLGFLAIVLMLIIYYFVVTLMATFFIFALYIAFKEFVGTGKKISMGAALSKAGAYTRLIIEWTIVYTIIRTVVKLIEGNGSRNGMGEMVLRAVVGIGLFLGITFAVPIIYEEKVSPITAIKKSAEFIINNIGKTFSGIIYFDVIGFVIKVIGGLFIASAVVMLVLNAANITVTLGGFTILGHTSLLEMAVIAVIGISVLIIGDLFTYVTLHIYYLVVYDYVRNGKVPEGMDESLIKSSIRGRAVSGNAGGGSGSGKQPSAPTFGGLFQSGGSPPPDMKDFVK